MTEVSRQHIEAARVRIAQFVQPTPVLPSLYLSKRHGREISLKLENLNIASSFKIRGASNALLLEPRESLDRGIIAASAGNHAQGVAHVANQLGASTTIFMPKRTPLIKIEATKAMGAEVRLVGDSFDEAYQAAERFEQETKGLFVHPYADPNVINGQGTCGLELLEQIQDLGIVVVPIGGGGLISGIGCAIKAINPSVKIIGVQAAAFPAMKLSFDSGKHVMQKPIVTIADGIAVKTVHERNLELVRKYVDEIVTVEEDEIAATVMELMERNHLLTEGAAAASVAALEKIPEQLEEMTDKVCVCVITGGNIDINLLRKIATKGLIRSGRLMRLRFTVQDRPGALADLLKTIAESGGNINEVHHDRLFGSSHYSDVDIDAVIETSSLSHQNDVLANLKDSGLNYERV